MKSDAEIWSERVILVLLFLALFCVTQFAVVIGGPIGWLTLAALSLILAAWWGSAHQQYYSKKGTTHDTRLSMNIRLEREDRLEAFGAFLRCEEQHDDSPVILLNVQAVMAPELEAEDGSPVPMTPEDRIRLVITTLMHEFGHALESHFRIPVNEDHIHKACEDWEAAYTKQKDAKHEPA